MSCTSSTARTLFRVLTSRREYSGPSDRRTSPIAQPPVRGMRSPPSRSASTISGTSARARRPHPCHPEPQQGFWGMVAAGRQKLLRNASFVGNLESFSSNMRMAFIGSVPARARRSSWCPRSKERHFAGGRRPRRGFMHRARRAYPGFRPISELISSGYGEPTAARTSAVQS